MRCLAGGVKKIRRSCDPFKHFGLPRQVGNLRDRTKATRPRNRGNLRAACLQLQVTEVSTPHHHSLFVFGRNGITRFWIGNLRISRLTMSRKYQMPSTWHRRMPFHSSLRSRIRADRRPFCRWPWAKPHQLGWLAKCYQLITPSNNPKLPPPQQFRI